MEIKDVQQALADCDELYQDLKYFGYNDHELEDTLSELMFMMVELIDREGEEIAKDVPL